MGISLAPERTNGRVVEKVWKASGRTNRACCWVRERGWRDEWVLGKMLCMIARDTSSDLAQETVVESCDEVSIPAWINVNLWYIERLDWWPDKSDGSWTSLRKRFPGASPIDPDLSFPYTHRAPVFCLGLLSSFFSYLVRLIVPEHFRHGKS